MCRKAVDAVRYPAHRGAKLRLRDARGAWNLRLELRGALLVGYKMRLEHDNPLLMGVYEIYETKRRKLAIPRSRVTR